VASSVPEALHEIGTHSFDLLLCDLNIGTAGDGYNVVRAVRQANPRCATVILTGYPALETAVQGIHHGVDDYLIKPAGVDALIATLAERLAARQPKARILSVSCDETLLRTRHMLLEGAGYEVVSALGYEAGLGECNKGLFDLFVLGHSIPQSEKEKMVEAFRRVCQATIISLCHNVGEQIVDGADFHIEPVPEPLLKLIEDVVLRIKTAKGFEPAL
jgi:DNA-binding response OmpR family regulator